MTNLRFELRPTHSVAALVLVSSLLGLVACEPRIEEPLPPSRDVRPDLPAVAPPNSPITPSGSDVKQAERGRCVFPTPDKPKRTLARTGPDPACPVDPTGPLKLRSGKVTFQEAKDKPIDVTVEIAERQAERTRGLMFRTNMPEENGMIFLFNGPPDVHQFWMHNTCLPLDMLFVDKDGVIVGIEENCPTMNDSTFAVPCPSSYVIEVNAGFCRRHGIVAGQKVLFDGI